MWTAQVMGAVAGAHMGAHAGRSWTPGPCTESVRGLGGPSTGEAMDDRGRRLRIAQCVASKLRERGRWTEDQAAMFLICVGLRQAGREYRQGREKRAGEPPPDFA